MRSEHVLSNFSYDTKLCSGGSKGDARGTPGGQNSFNFMRFLEKFGKISHRRVGTLTSGKSLIHHCK